MPNLRFALIGCGRIAEKHAIIINKVGELSAVVDILPENLTKFKTTYGAIGYHSLSSFLEANQKVDVAVICTPNGLHASQAILCLMHGMDVLLEKPIALSSNEISAISLAQIRSGKYIFPIMQNRFNPALIAIKKLLSTFSVGKVISFQINCFWNRPTSYYADSWHGDSLLDGGVLYTQISHFIDLLSWYFGECIDVNGFVTKVSAKQMDFEDTGSFSLLYTNNIIGAINYTINTVPVNIEGSFTLHTEKGTIKVGGTYLNKIEINTTPFKLSIEQSLPNDYGIYVGSGAYHEAVYYNFIDAYSKFTPYYTSLEEAAITIRTIEKMYLSVR